MGDKLIAGHSFKHEQLENLYKTYNLYLSTMIPKRRKVKGNSPTLSPQGLH